VQERQQVRRAAQVVELRLGFGVGIGGRQQLALDDVGGEKGVGLGKDDEVDAPRLEELLQRLHEADPFLSVEAPAAGRLDADVDVRGRVRRLGLRAAHPGGDLIGAAAEHVHRDEVVPAAKVKEGLF